MKPTRENPNPESSRDMRNVEFKALLQEYLNTNRENPVPLMLDLVERGAESQDYDVLIDELEPGLVNDAQLLERHQLLLRGDTIDQDEVEDPEKRFSNRVWGAVHHAPAHIKKEDRLDALAILMVQILARLNIARHYERKNWTEEGKRTTPILVYGFKDQVPNSEFDSQQYWDGYGDDMGQYFNNARVITFPLTTNWTGSGNRHSDMQDKLFPHIPIMLSKTPLTTKIEDQRISRISKAILHGRDGTSLEMQVKPSRSYFDLLLVVDKIFYDMKTAGNKKVEE